MASVSTARASARDRGRVISVSPLTVPASRTVAAVGPVYNREILLQPCVSVIRVSMAALVKSWCVLDSPCAAIEGSVRSSVVSQPARVNMVLTAAPANDACHVSLGHSVRNASSTISVGRLAAASTVSMATEWAPMKTFVLVMTTLSGGTGTVAHVINV